MKRAVDIQICQKKRVKSLLGPWIAGRVNFLWSSCHNVLGELTILYNLDKKINIFHQAKSQQKYVIDKVIVAQVNFNVFFF